MRKENGLVYFTCDENKLNYSQRNNEFTWKRGEAFVKGSTMCNVTSMCMALDYAGFKFPEGKFSQPEDNLCDFIMNSKEVDEKFAKSYPALYKSFKEGKKDAYTPNEIHSLLSLGTNLWMGCEITKFYDNVNIKKALYNNFVIGSLPLVLSGSFPKSNGARLNHIVTCTGVAYADDGHEITGDTTPKMIKIDDPYGNTLRDWQGSGNDIWLTWDYVVKNIKPLNSGIAKWAHMFVRPVAIV